MAGKSGTEKTKRGIERQTYSESEETAPFLDEETNMAMNQYTTQNQDITSVYNWNETKQAYKHVHKEVSDESDRNTYDKLLESEKFKIYPESDATRIEPWHPD